MTKCLFFVKIALNCVVNSMSSVGWFYFSYCQTCVFLCAIFHMTAITIQQNTTYISGWASIYYSTMWAMDAPERAIINIIKVLSMLFHIVPAFASCNTILSLAWCWYLTRTRSSPKVPTAACIPSSACVAVAVALISRWVKTITFPMGNLQDSSF